MSAQCQTVSKLILLIFVMQFTSLNSKAQADTIRLSETAILINDSLVCTTKDKIIELGYNYRLIKTELRIIQNKLNESDHLTLAQKNQLIRQQMILKNSISELKREKRKKWFWGAIGLLIGKTLNLII